MTVLEYSFDSAIKFGGWALSAILGLYTLYRNHISDQRIRRAELAQKSAEDRLRQIESRGKAPYFVPSSELSPQLYEEEDGQIYLWSVRNGNVLSVARKRIPAETEDGRQMILPLEDHGAAARKIQIETSLKHCVLRQEPKLDSARGRIFLKYQYERQRLGKPAELKISFE